MQSRGQAFVKAPRQEEEVILRNQEACVARVQGIRGLFCKRSLELGFVDSHRSCKD